MAANPPNVYLLEKTPEEEETELTTAVAPLVEEGFRSSLFSRNDAIDIGYLFPHFLKLVKTVAALCDSEIIEDALAIGVKEGFFTSVRRCELKKFCEFARFLKSGKGQSLLHFAQKTNKLKKRVVGTFEPKDIALEQLFNAQRADWCYVVKKEREAYDVEIDQHRRTIKQLEKTRDAHLVTLSEGFLPTSQDQV